jgi:hypothetical protein
MEGAYKKQPYYIKYSRVALFCVARRRPRCAAAVRAGPVGRDRGAELRQRGWWRGRARAGKRAAASDSAVTVGIT